MKRIAILVVLASSLQAQLQRERSPVRIDDRPALRMLHRHLRLESATAIVLGDFDGDGRVDVLEGRSPGAVLHLGRGDAFFRAGWSTAEGSGGCLAGDVDGDGRLDLVRGGGELFLNDGARGFDLVPGAMPPFAQPRVLGDLDGDGDLDALATQVDLSFQLLTNAGGGTFERTILGFTPAAIRSIALGDVDGDEDLDALLGQHGQTQLFLGDGAGGFVDATASLPRQSLLTESVALGDLDGDGDLDAVLGNGGADSLWLGGGDGTFVAFAGGLPATSQWTNAVALFDLDGDGDLDLYEANGVNPLLPIGPVGPDLILLNDGSASFQLAPNAPPVTAGQHKSVVAGDVDQDEDIDLLVAAASLLLNDGTGRLWLDDGGVPVADGSDSAVVLADLDGDGWLDAVVANHSDIGSPSFPSPLHPGARVLLGEGTGSFRADPSWFASQVRPAVGLCAGDVDGDGDLDLAFACPWDGEIGIRPQDNQLYRNDRGTFTDVSASALPAHFGDDRGVTSAVAMADVDGDGDLDLLLADTNDYDGGGGGITLYRNGGSGTFADALLASGIHGALDVKVLDLEADGDPDLLFANDYFGLGLLENDGTGAFQDKSSRLPGATAFLDEILWSVAADLDADGDVDLAGAVRPTYPGMPFAFWYAGDGAGSFGDASARIPQSIARPRAGSFETCAAADLDGDGDLDLVGQRSLLENDGAGRLSRSHRSIESPGGVAAFADLDLDGDLDAFWAAGRAAVGAYPTRRSAVGANPTRHLASRGLPRIAKQLHLDVLGPVSEPWLLASSTERVRIPLAIGLLQLDPSSTSVVASGTLSKKGEASWSTAVPNQPALLGSTLYWQALVGAQPRLTNAERTTFTAF